MIKLIQASNRLRKVLLAKITMISKAVALLLYLILQSKLLRTKKMILKKMFRSLSP